MARKIIRPLSAAEAAPLSANGHRPAQRVAVYVRVSSEEQLEGYSLDAQLRAARGYCAERGWEIVATYPEEGRSARYEDLNRRPRFKAMLEAAAARQVDVVLVHKLDRFARNLLVLLETLGHLGRADVALESCTERLDYATPQGKLFMVLMGGIAQWYSDNLSQETKKGKRERKAQGLYNGLLPFGTGVGAGGLPAADRRPFCVLRWVERDGGRAVEGGRETCNFEGLQLAVRLAAEGATDGAVAQALNAAGYRTTGNRGANPFHKDTIAEMLTNRFYWGELPVFQDVRENGATRKVQVDWAPAKHEALPGFDEALWDRIQATRAGNRKRSSKTRSRARTYALTGLLTCHACGGPVGIMAASTGEPRLSCRRRARHKTDCPNRLTYQDVYEAQIGAYLAAFKIPEDYQERLLAAARAISPDQERQESERRTAEARLERIKNLYEWGDKPEAEYLAERAVLQARLRALRPTGAGAENLDELAALLRNVQAAWEIADQESRNHLARAVFEDVRVLDDRVVGLKPRPSFAPFFVLNHEVWEAQTPPPSGGGAIARDYKRKRRDSNPRSQP